MRITLNAVVLAMILIRYGLNVLQWMHNFKVNDCYEETLYLCKDSFNYAGFCFQFHFSSLKAEIDMWSFAKL